MQGLKVAAVVACVVLVACDRAPDTVAPRSARVERGPATLVASDNAKPNFNLEAILRAPDGADGFGHVRFRQNNDDATRVDLQVWVRDLAPNTRYRLQRAVDTTIDDVCTSNSWLTLGEGAVPKDVLTDDRGTGKADLFRVLTVAVGTPFDIRFRVVTTAGTPVLTSDCYQFFVR